MSYNGTYVRLWFLCGLNTPRSSPGYEPPGYDPQTVFDGIAAKVTHFLTRHSDTWWVDKHEGLCNTEIPCPCCIVCYDGIDCCRERVCQLCLAAWRLSAVSTGHRDAVLAIGKSHPRWERIEADQIASCYQRYQIEWWQRLSDNSGYALLNDWLWLPEPHDKGGTWVWDDGTEPQRWPPAFGMMALRPGGRRGYKPQDAGYQWTTSRFGEDERLKMTRILGLATPLFVTRMIEAVEAREPRYMYRSRGVAVVAPHPLVSGSPRLQHHALRSEGFRFSFWHP